MEQIFADVTDIVCKRIDDQSAILSWARPYGCHSVDVTLTNKAGIVQPTENARDNKRFIHLAPDDYIFKLKARYPDFNESPGTEFTYRHEETVEPFTIQVVHMREYTYSVIWQIPVDRLAFRILANGTVVAETTSDAGYIEVELPMNDHINISAQVLSKGIWMQSTNEETICTCLPMEVDADATLSQFSERATATSYSVDIPLVLRGEIPSGVTGFYYVVRTNEKWADTSEIALTKTTFTGIRQQSLANYKRNRNLPYDLTVRTEEHFFVTLFTAYADVCVPSYTKVKRPLRADAFWAVRKKMFAAPLLTIEFASNMPIDFIPRIILCACPPTERLASHEDFNAQIVCDIPEEKLDKPASKHKREYELRAKLHNKQNLFMFIENPRFLAKPLEGFDGKF